MTSRKLCARALFAMSLIGCKETKYYKLHRADVPGTFAHHTVWEQEKKDPINFFTAYIHSPARDQALGDNNPYYAVISEDEMRKLGLNPNNYCEYFDKSSI